MPYNSTDKNQPYRSVVLGHVIRTTAQLLMILVPFLWFEMLVNRWLPLIDRWIPSEPFFYTYTALMIAILIYAPRVITYGKRIATPDALKVLQRDPRPPVVFLRPFNEDDKARTEHDLDDDQDLGDFGNINSYLMMRLRGLRVLVQGFLGMSDLTLEEEFDYALSNTGPVIAIGKPGEAIQTAGAYRFYVDDLHWKDAIRNVLKKASTVIWHAGMSEGTWWELETIVKDIDPRRLIMIIPNPRFRLDAYRKLRERSLSLLPVDLPDSAEDVNLVIFNADWQPTFLKYRIHEGIAKFFMINGLDLKATLTPFTKKLAKLPAKIATNTGKSSIPASRWSLDILASSMSVLLAILLAISLHIGGQQYASHIESQDEVLARCNDLLKTMHTINSPDTTAGGWLYNVRESRAFFADKNNSACLTANQTMTRNDIIDKFNNDVRNLPPGLVNSWMRMAEDGRTSLETISEAINISGNKELLINLEKEKKRILDTRYENIITLTLSIKFLDDIKGAMMLDILQDRMKAHISDRLTGHFQKIIPAPYNVRLASDDPFRDQLSGSMSAGETLSQFRKHIKISLEINTIEYGPADMRMVNLILPDRISAQVDLTGGDLFKSDSISMSDLQFQRPEQISYDNFDKAVDKITEKVTRQILDRLSPQAIACASCKVDKPQ